MKGYTVPVPPVHSYVRYIITTGRPAPSRSSVPASARVLRYAR